MIELATGEFPYPKWDSVFQLLTYVLKNDPPSVPESLKKPTLDATIETIAFDDPVLKPDNWKFSPEFRDFVNQCLRRDFHERPKYQALKVCAGNVTLGIVDHNCLFQFRIISTDIKRSQYVCINDHPMLDLHSFLMGEVSKISRAEIRFRSKV